MIRDILQKQYDFELEQKTSITSATNIPIVALTIIGSAISSMLIGFHYTNNISTYFFVLLLSLSIFSIFFSIYCVARTFLLYSWQKIPSANNLVNYVNELEEWYKENHVGDEDISQKVKNDFNRYFEQRLSEAADINSDNNIKRGNYLHNATASATVAFVLLALSSPFYIYQKASMCGDVYKVNIVNKLELLNEGEIMSEKKTLAKGQQHSKLIPLQPH